MAQKPPLFFDEGGYGALYNNENKDRTKNTEEEEANKGKGKQREDEGNGDNEEDGDWMEDKWVSGGGWKVCLRFNWTSFFFSSYQLVIVNSFLSLCWVFLFFTPLYLSFSCLGLFNILSFLNTPVLLSVFEHISRLESSFFRVSGSDHIFCFMSVLMNWCYFLDCPSSCLAREYRRKKCSVHVIARRIAQASSPEIFPNIGGKQVCIVVFKIQT